MTASRPGDGRAVACPKLAARELREIKSTLSTTPPPPGGLFVTCVIGKAYPDAFSGADDSRLKAIRDARIRATPACFLQVEAPLAAGRQEALTFNATARARKPRRPLATGRSSHFDLMNN